MKTGDRTARNGRASIRFALILAIRSTSASAFQPAEYGSRETVENRGTPADGIARRVLPPKNSSTNPTGRMCTAWCSAPQILNILGAASQRHIPIDRRRRIVDRNQRCEAIRLRICCRGTSAQAEHRLVCSFTERRKAMSDRRPRRGQSNG